MDNEDGISFSWIAELRELLRRAPAPPRWRRAAAIVYSLDVLVIAICISTSLYFYGNSWHMFGEGRLGTLASVAVLIACGVVCFKIRNRLRGTSIASFWFAFGCLMCLAGADDLLKFHERLDQFIHLLLARDPFDPVTDHLDDMIVGMYALPAMYLAFEHRRRLLSAHLTLQMLAAAFVIFALHLLFDVSYWSSAVEESLKLTAGCTILLAFLATHLQPTLPASWTNAVENEFEFERRTDVRPIVNTNIWVRVCGAVMFVAMGCALVAALFALSAATGRAGTSDGRMFKSFAALAVLGAGGFFFVAHSFFAYASALTFEKGNFRGPAHAAWRAAAIGFSGALLLGIVASVWASRHTAPPIPPHVHSPRPDVLPE